MKYQARIYQAFNDETTLSRIYDNLAQATARMFVMREEFLIGLRSEYENDAEMQSRYENVENFIDGALDEVTFSVEFIFD